MPKAITSTSTHWTRKTGPDEPVSGSEGAMVGYPGDWTNKTIIDLLRTS